MIQKLIYSYRSYLVMVLAVLCFLIGNLAEVQAQTIIGARELALGQASTALQNTNWAMFSNPAMMSEKDRSVSFFGVRYFGLSEVTDMAVSFTAPTKYGVIGLGGHRYGFDLFNKSRLRLGYKNSFKDFHFGAILNYSHVSQDIPNGTAGALGVDVGVAAPILDNLWIGAKATNVNQPEYGKRNNEKLVRDLSVGLSYQLSDIALITSEVYKDVDFPVSYRAGVEVNVINSLYGRVGITTSPQRFTGGFGYNGKIWSANVAVQRHENKVLGFSPAIDFKINW